MKLPTVNVSERVFLALLLSGMTAGIGLGYVLAYRFPFKADKEWVDVLTAIGTVGAVIVALWQNSQARRLREADAKQRGHIVAAMRTAAIADLIHDLNHMEFRCSQDLKVMPDARAMFALDTFRALSHPMLHASVDELLAWCQLDRVGAIGLARSLGVLRLYGRKIENLERKGTWDSMDLSGRGRLLRRWQEVASSNRKTLEELLKTNAVAFDE